MPLRSKNFFNGRTDNDGFDSKLEFRLTLLPYNGDDRWVEPTLMKAYDCLMSEALPDFTEGCEHCDYRLAAARCESGRSMPTDMVL